MKRKFVFMMITAAVGMSVCSGCGQKAEEAPKAEAAVSSLVDSVPEAASEAESVISAAEIVDPDAGLRVFGTKSDAADTYRVMLKNMTGKAISGLFVLSADEQISSNNFAEEDPKPIAAEEQFVLYYDAQPIKQAAKDPNAALLCKLKLVFDTGEEVTLTDIPIGDVKEGTLCFEENIGYLTYQSISKQQEVSTKEAEQALRQKAAEEQQKIAAAKAAEEQKKAAEQAENARETAREQEEPEQYEAEEPAQQAEEPVYEEPAQEEPSNDGGSEGPEDDCLGDDALTW